MLDTKIFWLEVWIEIGKVLKISDLLKTLSGIRYLSISVNLSLVTQFHGKSNWTLWKTVTHKMPEIKCVKNSHHQKIPEKFTSNKK